MATYIWVNIGLSNGMLPEGTQQLPEPMLTYFELSYISSVTDLRPMNHVLVSRPPLPLN